MSRNKVLLVLVVLLLVAFTAGCGRVWVYRVNPTPAFGVLALEGKDVVITAQGLKFTNEENPAQGRLTATYLVQSQGGPAAIALPWAGHHTIVDPEQDISFTLNGEPLDWYVLVLPDIFIDNRYVRTPEEEEYGKHLLLNLAEGSPRPASFSDVIAALDGALPPEEAGYDWKYQNNSWLREPLPDEWQQGHWEPLNDWQHVVFLLVANVHLEAGSHELVVSHSLEGGSNNLDTILPTYSYSFLFHPQPGQDLTAEINLPQGYRLTRTPFAVSAPGGGKGETIFVLNQVPDDHLDFSLHRTFPASVLNKTLVQRYPGYFILGMFAIPLLAAVLLWAVARITRLRSGRKSV